MALIDRIEARYGGTVTDATAAETLAAGAAELVFNTLGRPVAWSEEVTIPASTGAALDGYRVLQALSDTGVPVQETLPDGRLVLSTSLFRATAMTPRAYRFGGVYYIEPNGGTVYAYPNVFSVDLFATTEIAGFPREAVELVAVYVAAHLLLEEIGAGLNFTLADRSSEIAALIAELGALTIPTSFVTPSFPIAETITIGDLAVASGLIFPTYSVPTLALPSVPVITPLDLDEVLGLNIQPPTPPGVPSITAGTATVPLQPTLASVVASTIAAAGTAPSWNAPTLSVPTALSLPALDASKDVDGLTTIDLPGSPPTAPTLVYADATVVTVSLPTYAVLPAPPSYTPPTFTKEVAPTDLEVPALTISATPPGAAPTPPTLTYTPASAASIGAVTAATLPVPPTFTKPSAVTVPAVPSITDIDLTSVSAPTLPTPPSTASFSYVDASAVAAAAVTMTALPAVPTITAATLTKEAAPDLVTEIPALTISATPPGTAPTAPTLSFSNASASAVTLPSPPTLGTAPVWYGPDPKPVGSGGDDPFAYDLTVAWNARMTDDDPEMVLRAWEEVRGQMDEHRTKVEEAQAMFNSDYQVWVKTFEDELVEYQAGVQKAIRDAELATEVSIKNAAGIEVAKAQAYAAEVQGYAAEAQAYQTQVNAEIAEWQTIFQRYWEDAKFRNEQNIVEYQGDLAENKADLDAAIVDHQQEAQRIISEFQGKIQVAISDAKNSTDVDVANEARTLEAAVQTYTANLQRYIQELDTYKTDIERIMQEWDRNTAQSMREWKEAVELDVQRHVQDLQAEQAEVAAEIRDYELETQRIIEQFRGDVEVAIEQARLTTQVNLQNALGGLRVQADVYVAEVQGYQGEVRAYADQVQAEIAEWETEFKRQWDKKKFANEQEVVEYQGQLQDARVAFEGAMTDFQEEVRRLMETYKGELQAALLNAQLGTQVEIENAGSGLQAKAAAYAAEVQGYLGKVESYRNRVNATIDAWRADVDADLRLHQLEIEKGLRAYASDVQAAIARLQSDTQQWLADLQSKQAQAEIKLREALLNKQADDENEQKDADRNLQASITDADRAAQVDIQEAREIIQDYVSKVQGYVAEVEAATNEYLTNHVQVELRSYELEGQQLLQQFSGDIQERSNRFNAELAAIQAEYQDKADEYTRNADVDVNVFRAKIEQTLGRMRTEVEAETARIQGDVRIYESQVQGKVAAITALSEEVRASAMAYQASAQAYQVTEASKINRIDKLLGEFRQGLLDLAAGVPSELMQRQ